MAFTDLAIARDIQEFEMLDRSAAAVNALRSLDKHVRAQVVATAISGRAIAASVEALDATERRNGFVLGEISAGLGLISDQLSDGFSELAYEQRLQSSIMKGILDALQSPSTVQAHEFRARGVYAYRNGWTDEAVAALCSSIEHDPFDFTVHQMLGDLRLRHLADALTAARDYSLAARYALAVAPADAAYAQMSLARALESASDFDGAKAAALEAARLVPDLPEAHYSVARASVLARDLRLAADGLIQSIRLKPEMSLLALEEPVFRAHSDWLESAITGYRDELSVQASILSDAFDRSFAVIGTALQSYCELHGKIEAELEPRLNSQRQAAAQARYDAIHSDPFLIEEEIPVVPDGFRPTPVLHELAEMPARIRAARTRWRAMIARNTILDLSVAIPGLRLASNELAVGVIRAAGSQSAMEPYEATDNLLQRALTAAKDWQKR